MVSDTSILPYQASSTYPSQYNGIFSGYTLFGVKTLAEATAVVKWYVDPTGIAGTYGDAIKNIFLVPKTLYGISPHEQLTDYGFTMYIPTNTTLTTINSSTSITRLTTIDGYTPKNAKMYTWPYSYLLVSNNVGGNAEYRYEDFTSATPTFELTGIITSGCDIKLNPKNYKNITTANQIYGLKMGKLPVCSWNTDSYAVWLAQNQLNMQVSLTRNLLKTGVGVVSKNAELIGGGKHALRIPQRPLRKSRLYEAAV